MKWICKWISELFDSHSFKRNEKENIVNCCALAIWNEFTVRQFYSSDVIEWQQQFQNYIHSIRSIFKECNICRYVIIVKRGQKKPKTDTVANAHHYFYSKMLNFPVPRDRNNVSFEPFFLQYKFFCLQNLESK